jgi:hypothetical protein
MKTSELTGTALDWAVAKCEGIIGVDGRHTDEYCDSLRHDQDGDYSPSTDWSQGGPIIEREGISVDRAGLAWTADLSDSVGGYIEHTESGPTPLIAAMRCYVASKLGDEVEIPEELSL